MWVYVFGNAKVWSAANSGNRVLLVAVQRTFLSLRGSELAEITRQRLSLFSTHSHVVLREAQAVSELKTRLSSIRYRLIGTQRSLQIEIRILRK
jgi:hypothetical protein